MPHTGRMPSYILLRDQSTPEEKASQLCDQNVDSDQAFRNRISCVAVFKYLLYFFLMLGLVFFILELFAIVYEAKRLGVTTSVTQLNSALGNPPVPLIHAHSHNDELQAYPFTLAIDAGFCSIEADVILEHETLYTGHSYAGKHTLEDQYIIPLGKLANKSRGLINPIAIRVNACLQHTLLIDMKTDPFQTWVVVEQILSSWNAKYDFDLFECYDSNGIAQANGRVTHLRGKRAPIQVVISGVSSHLLDKFAQHMLQRSFRCSTLDGRFADNELEVIQSPEILKVLSMVSAKWNHAFLDTLTERVEMVHKLGSRIRFWATPEAPQLWELLLEAQVDLINTDSIAGLKAFILGKSENLV